MAQLNRASSLAEANSHLPIVTMLKRFVHEGKVRDGTHSLGELWTLSDGEMED
jgi:hypothetical protein